MLLPPYRCLPLSVPCIFNFANYCLRKPVNCLCRLLPLCDIENCLFCVSHIWRSLIFWLPFLFSFMLNPIMFCFLMNFVLVALLQIIYDIASDVIANAIPTWIGCRVNEHDVSIIDSLSSFYLRTTNPSTLSRSSTISGLNNSSLELPRHLKIPFLF